MTPPEPPDPEDFRPEEILEVGEFKDREWDARNHDDECCGRCGS